MGSQTQPSVGLKRPLLTLKIEVLSTAHVGAEKKGESVAFFGCQARRVRSGPRNELRGARVLEDGEREGENESATWEYVEDRIAWVLFRVWTAR